MKRERMIEKIAKERLGLETLETRKSDSLEFKAQSVGGIEAALESGQVHKSKVFIPENKYGIAAENYEMNGIVELLRTRKNEPETIQFLADMLEE